MLDALSKELAKEGSIIINKQNLGYSILRLKEFDITDDEIKKIFAEKLSDFEIKFLKLSNLEIGNLDINDLQINRLVRKYLSVIEKLTKLGVDIGFYDHEDLIKNLIQDIAEGSFSKLKDSNYIDWLIFKLRKRTQVTNDEIKKFFADEFSNSEVNKAVEDALAKKNVKNSDERELNLKIFEI